MKFDIGTKHWFKTCFLHQRPHLAADLNHLWGVFKQNGYAQYKIDQTIKNSEWVKQLIDQNESWWIVLLPYGSVSVKVG